MNKQSPTNPGNEEDDQNQADTPDKLRNDGARWKERDMPEQEGHATPDDYEKPAPGWAGTAR